MKVFMFKQEHQREGPGTELQGKTQTLTPSFEAEGGQVKKMVCPMEAVMNCIESKCAWYVEEKNSCAVKLIAIERERKSR
jgi:hypothetical protein